MQTQTCILIDLNAINTNSILIDLNAIKTNMYISWFKMLSWTLSVSACFDKDEISSAWFIDRDSVPLTPYDQKSFKNLSSKTINNDSCATQTQNTNNFVHYKDLKKYYSTLSYHG